MSEYEQFPSEGPEPAYDPTAGRGVRPPAVDRALTLIWVSIGLSLVASLLSFLYLDDLIDTALESAGGASEMSESIARTSAIGGVIFTLVIGVALMVLFAVFIGKGANWARIVYTVLAGLSLVFGLLGLLNPAGPVLLVLLSVIGLAVTAATLWFLWQKESSAWFTGR
ncbi:MAG: hypothetical protein Q8Q02_09475 [Nocardioides sp.]|nr:hypothetical protein [Nocardioides sp.]